MTNILTPEWNPIPLRRTAAPVGTPLFRPGYESDRAALVVGGPLQLSVFQVYKRQRLWFTVDAQVWITGFAVSAGTLYVQDGPVLSAWDLTYGGCSSAINLASGDRWTPPSNDPASPPPSFYVLQAPLCDMQNALTAARNVDAWACLLEQTEAVEATVNADAPAANNYDPGTLADMQRTLRTMLGSANPSVRDPSLAAGAHASLAKALSAAAGMVFSAPVVRTQQTEGFHSGQVFALALDGTIQALDDTLKQVGQFSFSTPLRPEIVMSEVPQLGGRVLCHLHYVTADGGIAAIDASRLPMQELPKWNTQGVPDPARVLPLRADGGFLFGGGILGADFFVTPGDSTLPPVRTVAAPAGGWRDYDIASGEKLVLLSDRTSTRLVSYDATARVSDRWGVRAAPSPSRSFFWSGTGVGAAAPAPRLMLEMDINAPAYGSSPGFRVMLADSVDSTNPALTSAYPPLPQPLDSVVLGPGLFTTLPSIGWIRCRPLFALQSLYCVANSLSPAGQIEAFIAMNPATSDRPFDRWMAQVRQSVPSMAAFPAALSTQPLPVLPGVDAFVAFSLGAELGSVLPLAQASLAQLHAMAQPITIYIDRCVRESYRGSITRKDRQPIPNWWATLSMQPGGGLYQPTDDAARLYIDTKYAGAVTTLDPRCLTGQVVGGVPNAECTYCTLQLGVINTLSIEIPIISIDPSPPPPEHNPRTAS